MEKIWNEIEDLATNFEACRKTLAAIGDETRQHIILEMIRMDYNGSRVPDITEKRTCHALPFLTTSRF